MDKETVSQIIKMLEDKLIALRKDQDNPEISFSDNEYWAVKIEFKEFKNQLIALQNNIGNGI